jgi:hypothetical protein
MCNLLKGLRAGINGSFALMREPRAKTEERHTDMEWLRFPKQINRETLKNIDIHLIQGNYATHKHPKVKAWLKRHERFKSHFTPTTSS